MNWSYRVEPSSTEELVEQFYGFKFYKTLTDTEGGVVLDSEISAEEFKGAAPSFLVSGFRELALQYLKNQPYRELTFVL